MMRRNERGKGGVNDRLVLLTSSGRVYLQLIPHLFWQIFDRYAKVRVSPDNEASSGLGSVLIWLSDPK
jgi:hypothetical protein